MELSLVLDMYVAPTSTACIQYLISFTRSSQTVHENRIYSLKIFCGPAYPDTPPDVQFLSRVNLPFVSATDGKVDRNKLPVLRDWSRNSSIESVLVEIRR